MAGQNAVREAVDASGISMLKTQHGDTPKVWQRPSAKFCLNLRMHGASTRSRSKDSAGASASELHSMHIHTVS